jgi:hypothetical protein
MTLRTLALRKAGHSAIGIAVCVVIWAFTNPSGGSFWPEWVIFIAALDYIINVGKAALGDTKARTKLEKKYGNTE